MLTKITAANIQPGSITSDKLAGDLSAISGVPKITMINILDESNTVLDDTAVSLTGGRIRLTGSGFASGCVIIVGTTDASSVTFISGNFVDAVVPALSAGTYPVYLVNPDGGTATRIKGLTYSGAPVWVTGATLPAQSVDVAVSIQLLATSDSTVSYILQQGSNLPPGLSLSTSGLLSGTVTGLTEPTTYTFTVVAADQEFQTATREFSLTVFLTFNVEYLVIAGGGGSNSTSNNAAAGGGGGGYRCSVLGESSGGGASAENTSAILPGSSYTVTVGSGGASGGGNNAASNGSNSVFSSITAIGGGGAPFSSATVGVANNGVGGGSGSGGNGGGIGGSGNSGQGYAGGGSVATGGGGGGGAGGVGQTGTSGRGGNGGAGVSSSITGISVARAGGGGANAYGGGAVAGSATAGGGAGLVSGTGNSGTINTGGGGGGTNSGTGGAGGSGVVILKYPNSLTISNPGGGLTFTTSTAVTGFKVTSFTAGTGVIQFT